MIEKTAGLVLHSLKYGETSVIARVYTRKLGLQSYLVPGVRKLKPRIRQNLFQPLTILDLVVYYKSNANLQRIKEISCPEPFRLIPWDVPRASIALFVAEVLLKTIREQESNESLFDYLTRSIRWLDQEQERISSFHLLFLVQLSRHLGFYPRENYLQGSRDCFNMQEGIFEKEMGDEKLFLNKELSHHLQQLQNSDYPGLSHLSIPAATRRALLYKLIDYYRLHMAGMTSLNSHRVMETVLS